MPHSPHWATSSGRGRRPACSAADESARASRGRAGSCSGWPASGIAKADEACGAMNPPRGTRSRGPPVPVSAARTVHSRRQLGKLAHTEARLWLAKLAHTKPAHPAYRPMFQRLKAMPQIPSVPDDVRPGPRICATRRSAVRRRHVRSHCPAPIGGHRGVSATPAGTPSGMRTDAGAVTSAGGGEDDARKPARGRL